MKKFILWFVLFLIVSSFTYSYTPNISDQRIINKIHVVIDKVDDEQIDKLEALLLKIEGIKKMDAFKNSERIQYIILNIEDYVSDKLEWESSSETENYDSIYSIPSNTTDLVSSCFSWDIPSDIPSELITSLNDSYKESQELWQIETTWQKYYVCDTLWDDSNDGMSMDKPFKTASKAFSISSTMNAWEQVLFCKGGIFDVTSNLRATSNKCDKNNPCIIWDYDNGDGSIEKPLLKVSWTWIRLVNFEDPGTPDYEEWYIIRNLSLLWNWDWVGIFFYNRINHVLVDNLTIKNFWIWIQIAWSNQDSEWNTYKSDSIDIKNTIIKDNWWQWILWWATNLNITNSCFANNWFDRAVFNHNIYISSWSWVNIKDNILYQSALYNWEWCAWVSLVSHWKIDNYTIENNLVYEDQTTAKQWCWGIAVDPAYGTEESFTNLTIKNNTVMNVWNLSIGTASAIGASITWNNIYYNNTTFSAQGIWAPNRTIWLWDALTKDITIQDNNIYFNGTWWGKWVSANLTTDVSWYFNINNNTTTYSTTVNNNCTSITDSESVVLSSSWNVCK